VWTGKAKTKAGFVTGYLGSPGISALPTRGGGFAEKII